MIICKFCNESILDFLQKRYYYLDCFICQPNVSYLKTSNGQIVNLFKIIKNQNINYDYNFETLVFLLSTYSVTSNSFLSQKFENVSFSSAKEFESFGDRIYNLLVFI